MAPDTFWARHAWLLGQPGTVNSGTIADDELFYICRRCLKNDPGLCVIDAPGNGCDHCQELHLPCELQSEEEPWSFQDIPSEFWLLFYLPGPPLKFDARPKDLQDRIMHYFLWNAPAKIKFPDLRKVLQFTFLLPLSTALVELMGDQVYDVDMSLSTSFTVAMNNWLSASRERTGLYRTLAWADGSLERFHGYTFYAYKKEWSDAQRQQWTRQPCHRQVRMCAEAFGWAWEDRDTIVLPILCLTDVKLSRSSDGTLHWQGRLERDGWQSRTPVLVFAEGAFYLIPRVQLPDSTPACDHVVDTKPGMTTLCLHGRYDLGLEDSTSAANDLERKVTQRLDAFADSVIDNDIGECLVTWGEVWDTVCDEKI